MMRRTAVAALCGAALIVTPAFALAQTPQPTAITADKACGTVTLTFTGPADGLSGTHGFRWNAVNGSIATDEGARTGTVVVGSDEVETLNIEFPEDEFGGTAAVTVAVFFGPNSHLQKPLDVYPVDTDCKAPGENLQVTPTPTVAELCAAADLASAAELLAGAELGAELAVLDDLVVLDTAGEVAGGFRSEVDLAAVTDALDCDGTDTTPETPDTETPAPGDVLDCAAFPLTDGRTAQDVLDADGADPNRLDADGDRVACEIDDDFKQPDLDADEDFSQVGAGSVPRGGVQTGG